MKVTSEGLIMAGGAYDCTGAGGGGANTAVGVGSTNGALLDAVFR
jgi:hypothetical protein